MSEAISAVLLIAHGSRRAEANAELVQVAAAVAARCEHEIIEVAYLEIADPTIRAGVAACVDRGAQQVLMLPYFLSAGAHVVDDLQRHRREAAAAHPSVEFRLCEPLGLHPLMVDIVLDRVAETSRLTP